MGAIHPAAMSALLRQDAFSFQTRFAGSHTYYGSVLPYCDEPIALEAHARIPRRDLRQRIADPEDGGGVARAVYHVPCRKCRKCLWMRSQLWKERALSELELTVADGKRNYLVTLTLNQKYRDMLRQYASVRFGVDEPSELDRSRVLMDWVRDYLKAVRYRLRRNKGNRLRFMAISELHKDGTPHVHLLVHGDLTSKDVRGCWGKGFMDVRLVDEEGARYVTKYLTKANGIVRASIRYGTGPGSANSVRDLKDSEQVVRANEGPPGPESCDLRPLSRPSAERDAPSRARKRTEKAVEDTIYRLEGGVMRDDIEPAAVLDCDASLSSPIDIHVCTDLALAAAAATYAPATAAAAYTSAAATADSALPATTSAVVVPDAAPTAAGVARRRPKR